MVIPEINSYLFCQLIYDKRAKTIQPGKESLINKWYWENWTATCKRMKLDHFLTRYVKINSKWIKDLKVRPETIKLLQKDIDRVPFDTVITSIFFWISLFRQGQQKEKINKWDHIKLKSFCAAKETINKMKRQPTEWKKIFQIIYLIKS